MFFLPLAAVLLAAPARPAAPPPVTASVSSAIAGRLVFRQNGKAVPFSSARKAVGKKLGLELRQGATVVQAHVDDDGWFVAPAAPGRWRLEYLVVGESAEFVDPAREIEVTAGRVSCAGQLEVAVGDLEAELGANAGSKFDVKDDCSDPHFATLAHGTPIARDRMARPVAQPGPKRTVLDVLSGLRAVAMYGGVSGAEDIGFGVHGQFVLGWPAPLDNSKNFLMSVSVGEVERDTVLSSKARSMAISAGVGYAPFSVLELQAGADFLQPVATYSGGPGLFASARLGVYGFGIGGRFRAGGGGSSLALTIDLSPLYVVGSFL